MTTPTYYVVHDEMTDGDEVHLGNAPGLSGGAGLTLCGWVDVPHEETDGPATCVGCLRIVAYCKALRLPKPKASR